MIREIVKPTKNTYLLNLPDEMIGKTVEVIAFEIEKDSESIVADSTLQDIQKKYSKYPSISHENYQFNRDEAHDHE
jgi:hypothetical protein